MTDDLVAARLRGFGPLGILAVLVIFAGNLVVVPLSAVAFIRAINVAGHASVRMGDVRDAFVAAGCKDVRSFERFGPSFTICLANSLASCSEAFVSLKA